VSAERRPDRRAERRRAQGPDGRRPPRIGLRLSAASFVILAVFTVMIGRLWSLQVLQGPALRKQVVANQIRIVPVTPTRGLFLARDGQVIVGNVVTPVVSLDQLAAQDHPRVVASLAALLGRSSGYVRRQLANRQYSPYRPVPVEAGVPQSDIVYLAEHPSEFPGVTVTFTAQRTYPMGELAAHVLGYVGDISAAELAKSPQFDYTGDRICEVASSGPRGRRRAEQIPGGYTASDVYGQAGLEAAYEHWLHGRPGATCLSVDATGNVVGTLATVPPQPGDNLVLNIDSGLQAATEQALAAKIQSLQAGGTPAQSGAAVVLDPRNGAVLAMASYPTYNPSVWVGGISQANYAALTSPAAGDPLVDRALDGLYTPGSTYKLATSTAALNSGLISPDSLIDDATGEFVVPNCTSGCVFTNSPGDGALGSLNVSQALTASDDVFFYTLGYRFWQQWLLGQFGEAPVQQAAARYGLGQPTGIDLPGEASGQVDSPALRTEQHKLDPSAYPYTSYSVGDNIEMAFGQGETLVTPLQLANAYATFANGGTRYVPRVAAAVLSPSGRLVQRFEPRVAGHVSYAPGAYQAILTGLEGVVQSSSGTAYQPFAGFPLSQFPIAGKTGTATTSSAPGAQPTALFVAFGPLPDPRYLVAVVVDQGGYGATGAAPVARSIFDYLFAHPVAPVDLHPGRRPA
jgi:penicillin-binding protein 2